MPNLLSIEALEADREYIQKQREKVSESPWGTARLMWDQRLAEVNRQLDELRSSRATSASVALIFDGLPVIGQGDIRLDFSADALSSYQKIVAASLASLGEEEVAAKGKTRDSHKSKLYIRDIVRGSMGFILEELVQPQGDMFDTPLKIAVDQATQFVASLNTDSIDGFNSAVDAASPRLVGAVQKFAKVLKDGGATARIVGDEQRIALSLLDVHRMSDRFSNVEVVEETSIFDGLLLGILPESHEFELQVGDEDERAIIKGTLSDDLATKYVVDIEFKDQLLLQPVRAYVKYVRSFRNQRIIKEQVLLENLEPKTKKASVE